jgi:hypothetical protein
MALQNILVEPERKPGSAPADGKPVKRVTELITERWVVVLVVVLLVLLVLVLVLVLLVVRLLHVAWWRCCWGHGGREHGRCLNADDVDGRLTEYRMTPRLSAVKLLGYLVLGGVVRHRCICTWLVLQPAGASCFCDCCAAALQGAGTMHQHAELHSC